MDRVVKSKQNSEPQDCGDIGIALAHGLPLLRVIETVHTVMERCWVEKDAENH